MMLHVVGRVTEPVASFIAPGVQHLLAMGVPQTVMMLDDTSLPNPLARLPDGIEVLSVPMAARGTSHWRELHRSYRRLAESRDDIRAVHFHGVRPWMIGVAEHRRWREAPQVYLSPHGSRLMPLVPWAMAWAGARHGQKATIIATSDYEARHARRIGLEATASNIVIDERYFGLQPQAGEAPHILGGSYPLSREGADRFAHVGVLLSSVVPGVSFQWLGPCVSASQDRLGAAGIRFGERPGSADCPSVLGAMARSTLFVATAPNPRLPLMLAQAMAAGLPCVALNTPTHAELITPGHNGLLVNSDAELLTAICRLLDDPALRARLGQAARTEARRRFAHRRFAQDLMPGYGEAPWLASAEAAASPELR